MTPEIESKKYSLEPNIVTNLKALCMSSRSWDSLKYALSWEKTSWVLTHEVLVLEMDIINGTTLFWMEG